MQARTKYILAGLTAGTLMLGAAGAIAHRYDHGGHHYGWKKHHRGMMGINKPFRKFCRRNGPEMADHMLVRLKHRIKPTESQQADFDALTEKVRAAADKVQAACPPRRKPIENEDGTVSRPERPNPIERLARTEAGLEAMLAGVREVRPAAERLYATLSDEQKAELNKRPRRHWGWKKHHRGSWEDGEKRGQRYRIEPGAAEEAPRSE